MLVCRFVEMPLVIAAERNQITNVSTQFLPVYKYVSSWLSCPVIQAADVTLVWKSDWNTKPLKFQLAGNSTSSMWQHFRRSAPSFADISHFQKVSREIVGRKCRNWRHDRRPYTMSQSQLKSETYHCADAHRREIWKCIDANVVG